jgi:hypothetical protein
VLYGDAPTKAKAWMKYQQMVQKWGKQVAEGFREHCQKKKLTRACPLTNSSEEDFEEYNVLEHDGTAELHENQRSFEYESNDVDVDPDEVRKALCATFKDEKMPNDPTGKTQTDPEMIPLHPRPLFFAPTSQHVMFLTT